MKMSYYHLHGQRCHFIGQINNPFKIIRIIKHLDSSYNNFSENLTYQKSELHKSENKQRCIILPHAPTSDSHTRRRRGHVPLRPQPRLTITCTPTPPCRRRGRRRSVAVRLSPAVARPVLCDGAPWPCPPFLAYLEYSYDEQTNKYHVFRRTVTGARPDMNLRPAATLLAITAPFSSSQLQTVLAHTAAAVTVRCRSSRAYITWTRHGLCNSNQPVPFSNSREEGRETDSDCSSDRFPSYYTIWRLLMTAAAGCCTSRWPLNAVATSRTGSLLSSLFAPSRASSPGASRAVQPGGGGGG
jgi:hypothetical protein